VMSPMSSEAPKDDHPRKEDGDAPLWCTLDKNAGPISATELMNALHMYGEKAGIKKKVHPHSFRHDRATHLAANFHRAAT
jgi:integrase/recombinase XerD